MSLCLTIISYHTITPGQVSEITLEKGVMTVGRHPESDWVLSDPQCLVASKHCVIHYRDGRYCITDESTSGIELVNTGVLMLRGNSEFLENGEVIRIGDYEIFAHIDSFVGQDQTAFSGADSVDHFEALMEGHHALASLPSNNVPAVHFQDGSVREATLDLFEFLTPSNVPTATQPDHVPAAHHEFRPPAPLIPAAPALQPVPADEQSVIPENWDLLVEASSASMLPSVPQAPATSHLLNAFLRGAGVEHLPMNASDVEAKMETIGRTYRLMVEGLTDVLHGQTSLKGETGRQQHAVDPLENNPLKLAPNAAEALLLLLRHSNHAVMPPEQAIADSFADVRAHRLAMEAAVQASIKVLLERFEPAQLEARMHTPGVLSTFIGARHVGRWQQFTELYALVAHEAEEAFLMRFHREIRRAAEAPPF